MNEPKMNVVNRSLAILLAASLFFAICGFSAVAWGSEYPLASVAFLSEKEMKALNKLPAKTTHDAGKALAGSKARKKAAKKTGLKVKRLDELARLFDLMRVSGMGPRMAQLFHAAGVSTCAVLAKQAPEDLAKRLLDTNGEKGIANKVPDAAMLKDWIGQAKSLPEQYIASR